MNKRAEQQADDLLSIKIPHLQGTLTRNKRLQFSLDQNLSDQRPFSRATRTNTAKEIKSALPRPLPRVLRRLDV